jgi:hypothetical protein
VSWIRFSAEAVLLDAQLRGLHREGRFSDAIGAIIHALENAHLAGPSNLSYAEFQTACEASSIEAK